MAEKDWRQKYFDILAAHNRIPGGEASKTWLTNKDLRHDADDPHATAAWKLLVNYFPKFSWAVQQSTDGRKWVKPTNYPVVIDPDGIIRQPSLADLVRHYRGEITLNIVPHGGKEMQRVAPILGVTGVGSAFHHAFMNGTAILHRPPSAEGAFPIAQWLKCARTEQSTIFFGVCPDWGVGEDERYNFSGVGDGIGLVARRALAAMTVFARFASEHALPVGFVFGIGDFEADGLETLARIGITETEFRDRCKRSIEAIVTEAKRLCPEALILGDFITNFAGGRRNWAKLLAQAHNHVDTHGLADAMGVTERWVKDMAEARRSLYERWEGNAVDAMAKLKAQLPEYGAMGAIARQFKNPLVIGCDAAPMAPGWQILQDKKDPLPVIYAINQAY